MKTETDNPARAHVALTLPAIVSSLPAFAQALEEICRHAELDRETVSDLLVVLDEACSNVFRHAYAGHEPGALSVTLMHRPSPPPGEIEITLVDQGVAFNPLLLPAPELSIDAEDRPIGGLGVHLMRRLTDRQTYRYQPDTGNRLTLVKHIPPSQAG